MLGLPIKNLICASNKNNVLTEFFDKGTYNKNREFFRTNSPSMDILISSNLERFLYYASNCDTNKVSSLMNSLKSTGKYDFKNPYDYFYAYSTDEEKTLDVIKKVYEYYNYLIDPHTACSYNAYLEYAKTTKNDEKVVVLKNNQMQAVMIPIDEYERLKSLDDLQERKEIYETLQTRKNTPIEDYVSYEDALKQAGF